MTTQLVTDKPAARPGEEYRGLLKARSRIVPYSSQRKAHAKFGREVFTTGQVAVMLGVAPRTVSKWFDSGRLGGYRIPGSQDRRIRLKDLVEFAKTNGMTEVLETSMKDLRPLADRPVLSAFLPSGWSAGFGGVETDAFDLAMSVVTRGALAVVLGTDAGLEWVTKVAEKVGEAHPEAFLAVVLGDDREPASVKPHVFHAIFKTADGPGQVAEWLEQIRVG